MIKPIPKHGFGRFGGEGREPIATSGSDKVHLVVDEPVFVPMLAAVLGGCCCVK